jgi:hypothetical protein
MESVHLKLKLKKMKKFYLFRKGKKKDQMCTSPMYKLIKVRIGLKVALKTDLL